MRLPKTNTQVRNTSFVSLHLAAVYMGGGAMASVSLMSSSKLVPESRSTNMKTLMPSHKASSSAIVSVLGKIDNANLELLVLL